jgi:hypothetical protein
MESSDSSKIISPYRSISSAESPRKKAPPSTPLIPSTSQPQNTSSKIDAETTGRETIDREATDKEDTDREVTDREDREVTTATTIEIDPSGRERTDPNAITTTTITDRTEKEDIEDRTDSLENLEKIENQESQEDKIESPELNIESPDLIIESRGEKAKHSIEEENEENREVETEGKTETLEISTIDRTNRALIEIDRKCPDSKEEEGTTTETMTEDRAGTTIETIETIEMTATLNLEKVATEAATVKEETDPNTDPVVNTLKSVNNSVVTESPSPGQRYPILPLVMTVLTSTSRYYLSYLDPYPYQTHWPQHPLPLRDR